MIQVTDFVGDGAIAIEKDGGPEGEVVRQRPPRPSGERMAAVDHFRRYCGHAAMVGGAAAQETGAAVGFLLNDGGAGSNGSGAEGIGGAKDGDDGQADGGGDVHRAGIISEEEMALREESRADRRWRFCR